MDVEIYNAFWMEIEDSVLNNKGKLLSIEFDGCKLEATHHYLASYMGRPINNLTIIFTPKDIVWCGERKFWEREGSSRTGYKITKSQFTSLKDSVDRYMIKHNYMSTDTYR